MIPNLHSTTQNPKSYHSSTFAPESPTSNPFEFETTTVQLSENSPIIYADKELRNHNLRRHSHEDYDIDCDFNETDSVDRFVQPTTSIAREFVDILNDKPESNLHSPSLTTNHLVASTVQNPTIGESLRRMSESEEKSKECDTDEDQFGVITTTTPSPNSSKNSRPVETIREYTSTVITTSFSPSPNQLIISITLAPEENVDLTTISNTVPMRRMSESEEIQTNCDDDIARIDKPATEQSLTTSTTIHSTLAEDAIDASSTIATPTAPKLKTSTINELSRRMSESDVDCKHDKNDGESSSATTLKNGTNSMRRMSDSNENSSDCDSHEDIVDLTTASPIISDSMRRMSHIDTLTTELNLEDHTNPTIPTVVFDDPTEYVTECDTEMPLVLEAVVAVNSQESLNDVQQTKEIKENSLLCCPDSVCLLFYPQIPSCAAIRMATANNIPNIIRKIDELRDMYYLYETQVLITKMVGDIGYIRKRMDYEAFLISLWNDGKFASQTNIPNTCRNRSNTDNAKQIISSIYCFLNYTDNLLNETFPDMILEIVKRIETDFPNHKVVKYPKLRRTILQSIPKVANESDVVNLLFAYMQSNRNYEKERIFLLQLLFDIQERFEADMNNYSIGKSSDRAQIIDSIESLQENGLGIKMHRTS